MQKTNSTIIHVGLLVVLCIVQFVVLLGSYDIWDIDEGMHSAMARNMVLTGDWVTPWFNGEPFFDKPALFNWLCGISFLLFGMTEFAARFPAALCGMATVIVVYFIGRKAFGATAGLIAGAVLATSLEFAILSRVVQYDIPFTLFTTLALYFYCAAMMGKDEDSRLFLGFYVAAALAVLVKGPLGLVLPAIVIGFHVLFYNRWARLLRMNIPLGVLLFFAIAAPWFVLAEIANPGYLDYFIIKQHFANFIGDVADYQPRHPQPWFYLLPLMIVGVFPWCVVMFQAMFDGIRDARDTEREYVMFFLIWLFAMLLFFSAATSKLPTYVLPIFPAVALLIGRFGQEYLQGDAAAPRRKLLIGLSISALLLVPAAIWAVLEKPWGKLESRYGLEGVEVTLFLALPTAVLVVALLLAYFNRRRDSLLALVAATPVAVLYLTAAIAPDLTPYRSSKDIGLELDARLPPGEKMVLRGQLLDAAVFYTGRQAITLADEAALQEYLQSGDGAIAILVNKRSNPLDELREDCRVITSVANKAVVTACEEQD